MSPTQYDRELEDELIIEFVNKFHQRTGYYPTVITKSRITDMGVVILTLSDLEKYFDPYIPSIVFGRKITLGAKDRIRELVELRCMFFFIGRSMNYSLSELGRYLGNRDHTTVIHGVNVFKNLYETDQKFREKYHLIINKIKRDYESSTVEHIN
jgi:hypothetical protein